MSGPCLHYPPPRPYLSPMSRQSTTLILLRPSPPPEHKSTTRPHKSTTRTQVHHTSPPPDHNSVTTKSTIGLTRHCMFFFSKNHWIPQTWSHVTLPRIKPHDIMSMVTTKWWQTLASPQGGRCFVENLVLLCSTPPLQVSSSITLYSRPALHKTICVLNYRTFFFHYWWMLLVLVHLV